MEPIEINTKNIDAKIIKVTPKFYENIATNVNGWDLFHYDDSDSDKVAKIDNDNEFKLIDPE